LQCFSKQIVEEVINNTLAASQVAAVHNVQTAKDNACQMFYLVLILHHLICCLNTSSNLLIQYSHPLLFSQPLDSLLPKMRILYSFALQLLKSNIE
jgi:hypothetical protein